MSRPLRIEYHDAWYHVMNRGAGRRNIFHSSYDRELFFELLDDVHTKFKIEIHAYCLMTNHYHLLIKTPLPNLNRAMRHLNGVYALRFNKTKNTDGPLFRGRYKAILVEEENYLLRLSRYIHLNPVSANICKNPEDYKWSSYIYFIKNNKIKPQWLFTDKILSYIGESNQRQGYIYFLDQGIDQETQSFYQKDKTASVFGTEEFTKSILQNRINVFDLNHEIAERKISKIKISPTIDEVMRVVVQYYNCDHHTLQDSCKGKSNLPRSMAICLASFLCQQTFTVIAKKFGSITPRAISNAQKRMLASINNSSILRNDFEKLTELLTEQLRSCV